jgi:1,2-dihydroxy-3-keto-5-methylthiopentene dioxygenase
MTRLTVFDETGNPLETLSEHEAIAARLAADGVRLERWPTPAHLSPDAGQEEVLEAYRDPVAELSDEFRFQAVDVVSVRPDHPERDALRAKFIEEHTHGDFEVRFFVDGSGLFYLHPGQQVYGLECERGDFIAIPAGTRHWFDMGAEPDFKCIRFFTDPEGWVGHFSGSGIDKRFPLYRE